MKINVLSSYSLIRLFLITCVLILFLSSCDEGFLNFNEETGNVSLSFTAESAGDDIDKLIVFISSNDSGAEIEKTGNIEKSGSTRSADLYFSRIDTGSWNMHIKVLNTDGEVVSEYDDSFELNLGETVIAELEYYTSGTMDLFFEKPVGSQSESLVIIDKFDTLINVTHYYDNPIETVNSTAFLIAIGSGFDTSLSGIRADFPDYSYFEYEGGWSRALSTVEIDVQPDVLSISRGGYSSSGDYTLKLTDLNNTETTDTDNCYLSFTPETGFVSFTGVPYGGGDIASNMYEINDAQSGQTVFAYAVNQSSGYDVAETALTVFDAAELSPNSLPVNTSGGAASFSQTLLVIVTVDIDISIASDASNGINYHFNNDSPNLSPENLPGWLYLKYGDKLNYIGISLQSYVF